MKVKKCSRCGGVNLQLRDGVVMCSDCGAVLENESKTRAVIDPEKRKKWIFRGVILLIAVVSVLFLELTTHFVSNFFAFLFRGK